MGDYPVKLSKFLPDREQNHRRMIDKDLSLLYQLQGKQKTINDKLKTIYTYLTEDKEYYVDSISGSDDNDGASATPLKTIQKAIDSLPFNLNGYDSFIALYPGTYSELVYITSRINGIIGIGSTNGFVHIPTWVCGTNNNYNMAGNCLLVEPYNLIDIGTVSFLSVNNNLMLPDGSATVSNQFIAGVSFQSMVLFTDCSFGKSGTESNTAIAGNSGIIKFINCSDSALSCDFVSASSLPAGEFYLTYNTIFSSVNNTGAGELYVVGDGLIINNNEYNNAINCSFSNGTITSLTTNSISGISSSNGTITNINGTNISYSNGTITNGNILTIFGGNFSYSNGTITNATVPTIAGTNLSYSNGTITAASIASLYGANLSYSNGTITNLNGTKLNYTNATFTNGNISTIIGSNLSYSNITITSGLVTTLEATRLNVGGVTATGFYSDLAIIGALTSPNGTITNLNGTKLNFTNATFTNAYGSLVSTNISSSNATITNLTTTINNISASNGTITNLTCGTVSMTNAQIGSITLSGGQILFPATQVESSNVNCLDDYEEGTWTPVVQGSGPAGTYQLSGYNGKYIKIGSSVLIRFSLSLAGVITGGGGGVLQVSGLPFAPGDAIYQLNSYFNNVDLSAGTINVVWITSGSLLTTFETHDNAGLSNVPISGVVASDEFGGCGWYKV